jgi:metal-sulfur cluster biosynthetic enzyme
MTITTEPECPAFPHLPDDIQRALADFDARVADGRLPMAADEHPAIPAAAEAWISDFLHAHIPTEI